MVHLVADGQQLLDCLDRINEVERLLDGVHKAEAALASVRCTLSSMCVPSATSFAAATSAAAGQVASSQDHIGRVQDIRENAPTPAVSQAPNRSVHDQIMVGTHKPSADLAREQEAMRQKPASPPQVESQEPQFVKAIVHVCGVRCGLVVLHPECSFRLAWDLTGLLFILWETYAIPFYIAFRVRIAGALFVFVSLLNLYFIADIGASFLTGYKTANGHVEMRLHRVAHRYSRSWLLPDIVAGIPWEWLQGVLPLDGNVAQLTKMLRLLRITRLLRLLRRDFLPEHIKSVIDANPWLVFSSRVLGVLFVLCSITHWSACIWYIVGESDTANVTWLQKMKLQGKGVEERYIYALYFTLTTMTTVGYGDVTPQNYGEVCFVSVLLLIATVTFAALMGSLTDLITSANSEKNALREKVMMLSRYMSWRHVPADLFLAVRRHLLYMWETNRDFDAYEVDLKDRLPPVLRQELCYHIYGQILGTVPIFAWARGYEPVLRELANAVQHQIWSRGDRLFRIGQSTETVYVLVFGSVHVSLNESLFTLQATKPAAAAMEQQALQSFAGLPDSLAGNAGFAAGSSHWRTDWPGTCVLDEAWFELRVDDVRQRLSARRIQRRWLERIGNIKRDRRGRGAKPLLEARSIEAPAYFGESCLWYPYTEWDSTRAPQAYTARCEMRCEILVLTRGQVKGIIEDFSPWLLTRFETFRKAVLDGMSTAGAAAHNSSHAEGSVTPHVSELGTAAHSRQPLVDPDIAPHVVQSAGKANLQTRWTDLANRSRAEASRLLASRRPSPPRRAGTWSSLRDPLLRSHSGSYERSWI